MRDHQTNVQKPIGPAAAALSLFLAALWGGTPTAIQFTVDQLPPVFTAGLRFGLAALFMLVWCQFENCGIRLRKGQVTPAVINGLLLFVQIVLFTVGIWMTTASHATVLINTFVLWVAGIDHFVTKLSRLTAVKIAGLVFAAAAGFIIFVVSDASASETTQRDTPSLWGDLCLAASAFVLGVKIIYTKMATRHVEPGKLMLWHDIIGTVLFFLCSLLFEFPLSISLSEISRPTILGMLYQGIVVSGFCFAAQTVLLKRHSASGISVFSVATPLFGVSAAVMLRGDVLSPWLAASGIFAALGILLVNLPVRREKLQND
ncbi:MAG: DMT family transporter [Planctomycetaceae bacterium]|nr:DMT family transporter [Planctomycetaceae bacterium]MBT6485075.1 DMT family transporter [Planctomycetaceae bacterium]MBT6497630.1 DMT family transporter [Planctomycetaceae bacterium]